MSDNPKALESFTLSIPDDASPELKEVIHLCQQCTNAMMAFMPRYKAGSLTREDVKVLIHQIRNIKKQSPLSSEDLDKIFERIQPDISAI